MHKAIFAILFLLMPIDAFVPGAAVLREFGGRPFNIFLLAVILAAAVAAPAGLFDFKWRKGEFFGFLAIFAGFGISTFYFLMVQIWGAPSTDVQRTPLYSFISQFLVLASAILFLLYLRRFFEKYGPAALGAFPQVCLWVSVVHLFFFGIHVLAIGGLDIGLITGFMNWIRPEAGSERAFGLMSEPSYWGAFVAYSWPILFFCFRSPGERVVARLMAAVLIGTAIFIGARTLIGIVFIQVLIVVFASRISKAFKLFLFFVSAIVGLAVLIGTTDTFAVSDNLSSAMRLGSALLGVNVAAAHGLTGVGIGQFHYYFVPQYAPDFLFLSEEAAFIFNGLGDFRASTFNFFVRLVVELGVLGLIGYIWLIVSAGIGVFRLSDKRLRSGLGLAYVGALSFWLTQDSFLYSPAILFMAFGLSIAGGRAYEPSDSDTRQLARAAS